MRKIVNQALLLFLIGFSSQTINGQTKEDNSIQNEITFELRNDTLFSSTGFKIFVGQILIIGNPAGEAGKFRSIISKTAAPVPPIWGDNELNGNAIEHYVDSKKSKKKLNKLLIPGDSLTIKGIGLSKRRKPYFYMVLLSRGSENCRADVRLALILKELLLP